MSKLNMVRIKYKAKYKINDKVEVKVFNFTDTECVFVNGVIEGVDETTKSGKIYRVYIPATNDILYVRDCDIIPIITEE